MVQQWSGGTIQNNKVIVSLGWWPHWQVTSASVDGSSSHGQHQFQRRAILNTVVMETVVILQFYRLPDEVLLGNGDSCKQISPRLRGHTSSRRRETRDLKQLSRLGHCGQHDNTTSWLNQRLTMCTRHLAEHTHFWDLDRHWTRAEFGLGMFYFPGSQR